MGTERFRVIWPEELSHVAEMDADFGRIEGATAAVEDGRIVVRFPAPFRQLVLFHDERLTLAKSVLLYEAMKHFNARLEHTDGR